MTEPSGRLYVVATPIGNFEDISLRALRVLAEADGVAAEDTRQTGQLLAHHRIKTPLISCHEHNEAQRGQELIQRIKGGQTLALVSDAGTPLVSDPGYRLVSAAIGAGIPVVPLPGPSAAVAGLSVSGLPSDRFTFLGFPPKKGEKQNRFLRDLRHHSQTLILYESPRRVPALLENILQIWGDRRAVLAREMTKPHEEFIRGRISHIQARLAERQAVKGECTLLVEGASPAPPASTDGLIAHIRAELARGENKISKISKKLAKQYDLPRQEVYAQILKIKESPYG